MTVLLRNFFLNWSGRAKGFVKAQAHVFSNKKKIRLVGKRGLVAFYSRCPDAAAHGSIGASGSGLISF